MKVAWVFDKGFADCTLVALHSALRTASGPIDVHLHPTTEIPIDEACLDRLRQRFALARISLTPLTLQPQEVRQGQRLPISACGRLTLPKLHEGRLIYLDGDILVRRDLAQLAACDLGGMPLGACLAPGLQARIHLARAGKPMRSKAAAEALARRASRLGGLDLGRYFNSGVLVMDLDRIRAMGLAEEMGDIPAAAALPSLDQDWLNMVFARHTCLVPPEWNSGWGSARTASAYVPEPVRDHFEASRRDPAIVHFTGAEKPWQSARPPFRLHMLTKRFERQQRARFWAEYQHERRQTEALVGRPLFVKAGH